MKTVWKWSLETEAQRIVHTAYQIATGFYTDNGFIVLPPEFVKHNRHIVLYPDIDLETIPDYWKKSLRANIGTWPVTKDKMLVRKIVEKLENELLEPLLMTETEEIWKKAEKEIMSKIESITGNAKHIKLLTVYPSYFGTSVSFNSPKRKEGSVELFLRYDQDIFSLVEGLVSALIREELILDYNASWKEREFLVDYLVHSSGLSKVLKKYLPQTEVTATTSVVQKRQYTRLQSLSKEFLQKIKVPQNKSRRLTAKTFTLYLGGNKLNNLSWKERRVLLLLSQNKDDIVEEGKIAEIIFKDADHFSLYAMAKFIQRLREKLEENGIPGNIIETVRGKGYVLK